MAVCVAIIGKDNSPKYFSCLNPDEELGFQYKVLSSLDVVEEKLNTGTKTGSDSRELYLGMLYSLETHKIYGYVTNTKIKFIIVVDSTNTALRDNEIRSEITGLYVASKITKRYINFEKEIMKAKLEMFRKLHSIYTDVICNPFYIPGDPIISKSFDKNVKSIITGVV